MSTKLMANFLTPLKALATGTVRINFDGIPVEFKPVPLKKIVNWILVEGSYRLKPSRPWGLPTHLQIEPSSRCNLRCPACRTVTGLGRPGSFMHLDLFRKIVDEAADSVFLIALWGWGEPFTNPHIYDMIAYAKTKGIQLVCSTNGHLLAKPDNAKGVVASGLDYLIVAIDGATQETYALYRQPGELGAVLKGVRLVAEEKQRRQSATPLINVRMVVMRQNEHEIPAMIELARTHGADMLTLKTMNPLSSDPYSLDDSLPSDLDDGFVPENPMHQRFAYTGPAMTRIRLKNNPCKRLWNNPKILNDGSLSPCTCDVAGKLSMGDLSKNSLKQIWASPPYRRMRRQFRKNWVQTLPCCTCTYAYKGGSCIDEIISGVYFFDHNSAAGIPAPANLADPTPAPPPLGYSGGLHMVKISVPAKIVDRSDPFPVGAANE